MGGRVCARLARAGYDVVAHDERWTADGGAVAAAEADVLITMLPGTAELREVIREVVPVLRPGRAWIDMTSASPVVDREQAGLEIERLDAPVGGDPAAAERGELHLYVGGPAETVERWRSLLEVLGTVDHVGGHGAGHLVKLLVNLLWFGQAVASAEALLLARRAGLDLETVQGALGRSAAATDFIRRDLDGLLDGDYLASFRIDRCRDELRDLSDLAAESGVPFELSAAVLEAYERAVARFGSADGELLAVADLEARAGVELRRSD
jgi:3-hydroxyisobutyrate dehydrogenase